MAEASGPNPAALSKAIRAMQRGLDMVELIKPERNRAPDEHR